MTDEMNIAENGVEEQDITLGVRPEHIVLSDKGVAATIDVSEMMGSSVHLHVTAVGQDVIVIVNTVDMSASEVSGLCTGKEIKFDFGGNNCHVFSKETAINLEAK